MDQPFNYDAINFSSLDTSKQLWLTWSVGRLTCVRARPVPPTRKPAAAVTKTAMLGQKYHQLFVHGGLRKVRVVAKDGMLAQETHKSVETATLKMDLLVEARVVKSEEESKGWSVFGLGRSRAKVAGGEHGEVPPHECIDVIGTCGGYELIEVDVAEVRLWVVVRELRGQPHADGDGNGKL